MQTIRKTKDWQGALSWVFEQDPRYVRKALQLLDSKYELNLEEYLHQKKDRGETIFVDGSCYNNGKPNARGAAGLYFEDRDLTLKKELKGKVTNNRTEFLAIKMALQKCKELNIGKATIITDSEYCKNSITMWGPTQKKNGWKKSDGKPALNVDFLKPILKLRKELPDIQLRHTSEWGLISHQKAPDDVTSEKYRIWLGNKKADEAAALE